MSSVWRLKRRADHIDPIRSLAIWNDYLDNRIGPREACAQFRSMLLVGEAVAR